MDALSCSVFLIFPLSPLTLLFSLSLCVSFPPYLYLILLSEATEAKKKKRKKRGQTLFYSNPKPGEQTQIQPNRIYSRVPLQMVICRLSIGLGAGAPVIDTPTTTQLREEEGKEEMLISCCNYLFSLFYEHYISCPSDSLAFID